MAKEGLIFFFPPLLLAVILFYVFLKTGSFWPLHASAVFFFFALCMAFFFRDPERRIPNGDGLVVSPADGKVLFVDDGGDGTPPRLGIFMSVFSVHVNRVPADGVVRSVSRMGGKFRPAYSSDAAGKNHAVEVTLETRAGELRFRQIAGILARRISCRLKEGQQVKRGERFGLIRFGSRVDVEFPPGSEIRVKPKQHVRAGSTVIGVFPDA